MITYLVKVELVDVVDLSLLVLVVSKHDVHAVENRKEKYKAELQILTLVCWHSYAVRSNMIGTANYVDYTGEYPVEFTVHEVDVPVCHDQY